MIFAIELAESKRLNIEQFENSDKDILNYVKFKKVKNIIDASSPDRKFFKTEKAAQKFIEKFIDAEKKLTRKKDCKNPDAPCLIYKKRYLIQSIMKIKNCTVRKYKKDWKKGTIINLYDQTNYLSVKISSIEEIEKGKFQYNFKVL